MDNSDDRGQPTPAEEQDRWDDPAEQTQPEPETTPQAETGPRPRQGGGLLKGSNRASPPTVQPSADPAPAFADLEAQFDFSVAPPPPPAQAPEQPVPAVEPPAPPDHLELLRVLVDRESREIVLEVDGQRYAQIGQVKDRTIGRRILEVVALLLQFSRGKIATVKGLKSLPVPEARLSALPPESSGETASQTEAGPAQGMARSSSAVDSRPPDAAPTALPAPDPIPEPAENNRWQHVSPAETEQEDLSFVQGAGLPPDFGRQREEPKPKRRSFFSRRSKEEPEETVPTFDLASEINRILQEKLAIARERTPVDISSSIDGGLRIQVGSRFYTEVGSVEPVEIRALIQAAIQEWEQKAFSGGSFNARS